jgi:hypothetical protein
MTRKHVWLKLTFTLQLAGLLGTLLVLLLIAVCR